MVAKGKPGACRPQHPFCGPMSPHDEDGEGFGMPAFLHGIVSPFMACWQPPINACMSSSQPMRPPSVVSQMVEPPMSMPHQSTIALTRNIRTPHPNDVLCGRGGTSNRHIGNLNFRSLVAANKDMYVTLTKKQKMMVARAIVDTVRNQEPPGRFLQKDPETGLWHDIGTPRSLEKTSQALREKTHSSDKNETASAGAEKDEASVDDARKSPTPSSPAISPSSPEPCPPKVVSPVVSPKYYPKPSETPKITIPKDLEKQFSPQHHNKPMAPRSPPAATTWPPSVPMHPHVPPQPYLPPYQSAASHPMPYAAGPMPPQMYHPSYAQAPQPVDYREYGMSPTRGQSSPSQRQPPHPYPPMPTPSSSIPTSPIRTSDVVAPSPPSLSPRRPQTHTGSRQGGKISPGRQQECKRRRQGSPSQRQTASSTSPSPSLLSRDMQSLLNLDEGSDPKEIPSPSAVLQSRSRRGAGEERMSGLAALSSAALLKLDEEEDN